MAVMDSVKFPLWWPRNSFKFNNVTALLYTAKKKKKTAMIHVEYEML